MSINKEFNFIQSGQRTIELEQQAIISLKPRIDDAFVTACQLILDCQGRVVVTGMGKSGHIGNKIAATLASTALRHFLSTPAKPATAIWA